MYHLLECWGTFAFVVLECISPSSSHPQVYVEHLQQLAGNEAGRQSDMQAGRHLAWRAGKRGKQEGCCAGACKRRQKGRQGRRSMQDNLIIFEGNCPMMYMGLMVEWLLVKNIVLQKHSVLLLFYVLYV